MVGNSLTPGELSGNLAAFSMPICFGLMSLQFLRFVIGPETLHSGEAGMHE